MQASPAAAAPRRDNLLGICAAIGEDFGFNPDILRVVLTASLLWNPAVVLSSYAFAGLVVLASRKLFPKSKPARVASAAQRSADVRPLDLMPAEDSVPLARAA